MIKTIKITVLALAAILLAWLLPWLYHFVFATPGSSPFTLYSCVAGKFVYIEGSDRGPVYRDLQGGRYSEGQFDSILPFFYYRQLATDGRLSDTICGRAVTPQRIGRENFIFRHSPQDVNVRSPKLYPLLESMSGRVDLKMPPDVFRLKRRIEFIDMKTNAVDRQKSDLFARTMESKGFTPPLLDISGNPTTRKEYDEGYLLIDAIHRVYHLKMNAGRPFFRDTGVPASLGMRYAFITEFSSRRCFGLLSDAGKNLYVLLAPTYELRRLPVEGFDPATESLMIVGDMLHWTVRVSGPSREVIYAIDAGDFSLADSHEYPLQEDKWDVAGRFFFPFEVAFTSHEDKYVQPRFGHFSWHALGFNLLLAACYLLLRRRDLHRSWPAAAAILPLGLFLFIPLSIMERG